MAETDKKVTTVYNELKTAITAAESDVETKDQARVDADKAYNTARQDLIDKKRKKLQLESIYPELIG
tara:strand:+ start:435 stop:635 length:201 start_codon:yes stop_codon:yes gene_type:complete